MPRFNKFYRYSVGYYAVRHIAWLTVFALCFSLTSQAASKRSSINPLTFKMFLETANEPLPPGSPPAIFSLGLAGYRKLLETNCSNALVSRAMQDAILKADSGVLRQTSRPDFLTSFGSLLNLKETSLNPQQMENFWRKKERGTAYHLHDFYNHIVGGTFFHIDSRRAFVHHYYLNSEDLTTLMKVPLSPAELTRFRVEQIAREVLYLRSGFDVSKNRTFQISWNVPYYDGAQIEALRELGFHATNFFIETPFAPLPYILLEQKFELSEDRWLARHDSHIERNDMNYKGVVVRDYRTREGPKVEIKKMTPEEIDSGTVTSFFPPGSLQSSLRAIADDPNGLYLCAEENRLCKTLAAGKFHGNSFELLFLLADLDTVAMHSNKLREAVWLKLKNYLRARSIKYLIVRERDWSSLLFFNSRINLAPDPQMPIVRLNFPIDSGITGVRIPILP